MTRLRTSLAVAAMALVRGSLAGGPGSPEAAQVHGRLMSFEESLRALRAPYERMPRI
jgi:hypothetical protein